jgi:hypothetical protein
MPIKTIQHFGNITFKHKGQGLFPDPCIKIRKGAGKQFVKNWFDPTTAFTVEVVAPLTKKYPKRKKQPFQTVCLYALKKRGKK